MAAEERKASATSEESARIAFLHDFNDSYVRTRHNNLRCFPSCGRVHRESSFCGRSVEVKIAKSFAADRRAAILFGEFRRLRGPMSYQLNEAISQERLKQDSDRIAIGEYVNMNEMHYRFVFSPNKKWRYDAKVPKQTELHVFTVYLVVDGVIAQVLHSKGFHVVPVWKTEDQVVDKPESPEARSRTEISTSPDVETSSNKEPVSRLRGDDKGESEEGLAKKPRVRSKTAESTGAFSKLPIDAPKALRLSSGFIPPPPPPPPPPVVVPPQLMQYTSAGPVAGAGFVSLVPQSAGMKPGIVMSGYGYPSMNGPMVFAGPLPSQLHVGGIGNNGGNPSLDSVSKLSVPPSSNVRVMPATLLSQQPGMPRSAPLRNGISAGTMMEYHGLPHGPPRMMLPHPFAMPQFVGNPVLSGLYRPMAPPYSGLLSQNTPMATEVNRMLPSSNTSESNASSNSSDSTFKIIDKDKA